MATCCLCGDPWTGEARVKPPLGRQEEARSPPHANAPPRRCVAAPPRRRNGGPSSVEDQKARRSTSADRPFALVPSIERFGRHHRPVRGHAPLGRAAPHGTASGGHGCGRSRLSNKISRIGVRAASTFLFVSNTVLLHLLGLLGERTRSRAPVVGPLRSPSPTSRRQVAGMTRIRDIF